jgi:hypothetical protein
MLKIILYVSYITIFILKQLLQLQNKYNTIFTQFLLIIIFLKGGEILYVDTHTHTHTHTNHVDFKYVFLLIILWKKN